MDLNEAWKSTCKVLLGGEIGDMARYEGYLSKYVEPIVKEKSSISGKAVSFSSSDYPKGSKFLSYDEIREYEKRLASLKLGINDLKDIGSMLEAVGNVAYYCGDAVLGNSQNVVESNRCFNSFNVYLSQEIYDSKFVAYSSVARFAEYLFGSNGIGETKFGIKNYSTYRQSRCMETYAVYNSSDIYFSANLDGCLNCFFCFGLKNRSNSIGNCALSKDEYAKISASLKEQLRCEFESHKSVQGLVELLSLAGPSISKKPAAKPSLAPTRDFSPFEPSKSLEAAFADTTNLLFGSARVGIKQYRKWLFEHVPILISVPSGLSGDMVFGERLSYNTSKGVQQRLVKLSESIEIGKNRKISKEQAAGISMENAHEMLKDVAFASPEVEIGKNIDVVACAAYTDAVNALECWWPVHSKNAAYCGWSRQSENTFGCSLIFSSKFCIKCFNSLNLARCFEVSNSNACTGSYFCHNCENLDNCMFCFNTKSKRYAICNVEVGKEKYLKAKMLLLDYINKDLDAKKSLELSIFNLRPKKNSL